MAQIIMVGLVLILISLLSIEYRQYKQHHCTSRSPFLKKGFKAGDIIEINGNGYKYTKIVDKVKKRLMFR